MLHSLDLRNVHQRQKSILVENFTVGRKHASELERQHAGITARPLARQLLSPWAFFRAVGWSATRSVSHHDLRWRPSVGDKATPCLRSGLRIALYTGNDDNILIDLLTPYDLGGEFIRFAGGLLGHWAVWTTKAVAQLAAARQYSNNIP